VARQASIVALIVILWVVLTPVAVFAQTNEFTVSVQSAAVRKGPSTGSPIVGHADRGVVLEVTRDIGAWVKVTWPEAPDGIGYVHQSMGKMSQRATREERIAAAVASLPPAEPLVAPAEPVQAAPVDASLMQTTRTIYVPPPTHTVGVGGQLSGATPGFGFTSRIWSRKRLGVQLELSRSTLTTDASPQRVRSTQFAPSVLYALPDYVSDNVWLRPYFGGGGAFVRSKLTSGTPEVSASVTDSSLAWRAFGGTEVTVPGVPRFAMSADVGYQWTEQSFVGFETGGLGFAISAHWYVK
jgi:opacity protein-like surface antigen